MTLVYVFGVAAIATALIAIGVEIYVLIRVSREVEEARQAADSPEP